MLANLRDGLRAALKSRDRVAISALRSTLAAIENAEALPIDQATHSVAGNHSVVENEHVAGGAAGLGAVEAERRHLTEDDLRSIVEREASERLVAAGEYEQAGRSEHAERLRSEADVLNRYLNPTR